MMETLIYILLAPFVIAYAWQAQKKYDPPKKRRRRKKKWF